MLTDDEKVFVEDIWSRIFALSLGVGMPDEKVMFRFMAYLDIQQSDSDDIPLTEEEIYNQLPLFLESLCEVND